MKSELNVEQLDQVNGGGIFSRFRDKQYAAAGITVKGAGWFYNDGYEYNGKEISTDEANSYEYDYCDH